MIAVKSFSHSSFFQRFDRLLREVDPDFTFHRWTDLGVEWNKVRHSYSSAEFSQTVVMVTVRMPGRKGWELLVVREAWWVGESQDPIKTQVWSHLNSGKRTEALAWFDGIFSRYDATEANLE